MNKKVLISAIVATLFVGCTTSLDSMFQSSNEIEKVSNIVVDEKDLGLRNVSLYTESEAVTPGTAYSNATPGSGVVYERAFEDAPPMIPHSTENMLPITKDNNQCITCHTPSMAKAMGATPVPASHLVNMRPETAIDQATGKIVKNGEIVENTSDVKKITTKNLGGEIYQGRFNCTQCHAPQAQLEPAVASSFEADYSRRKDAINKADFLNSLDELKLYE